MVSISLISQSIKNARIEVNPMPNGEHPIEAPMNYSVNFRNDGKEFRCLFRQEVRSKDIPGGIEIMIEMVARFSCMEITTDEERREAHVESYKMLFPYMQSIVSDFMQKAGLTPINLQPVKMDSARVAGNTKVSNNLN